ncbi:MAG: hypothetical protein ACLSH6_04215 [Limosilactobacillus pontis]
MRSLRCSNYGDDNLATEQVTYASLEEHFKQLQSYIDNGTFYSLKEFFAGSMRRHNHDNNDLMGILNDGINYLSSETLTSIHCRGRESVMIRSISWSFFSWTAWFHRYRITWLIA